MRGGGQNKCGDNCVTRQSSVAPSPAKLFSMTNRPCMKIKIDRDHNFFQKIKLRSIDIGKSEIVTALYIMWPKIKNTYLAYAVKYYTVCQVFIFYFMLFFQQYTCITNWLSHSDYKLQNTPISNTVSAFITKLSFQLKHINCVLKFTSFASKEIDHSPNETSLCKFLWKQKLDYHHHWLFTDISKHISTTYPNTVTQVSSSRSSMPMDSLQQ